jgi:hypothetical protein
MTNSPFWTAPQLFHSNNHKLLPVIELPDPLVVKFEVIPHYSSRVKVSFPLEGSTITILMTKSKIQA